MQIIFIYVNIPRSYDEIIGLIYAKQKQRPQITINYLVAEYMLKKVLIHVFVSSSKTFMKNVLKQSF